MCLKRFNITGYILQSNYSDVKKQKNTKFWGWFVLFLGLLLVWSLSKGLWGIREGYKRVDEAESLLFQEKKKRVFWS